MDRVLRGAVSTAGFLEPYKWEEETCRKEGHMKCKQRALSSREQRIIDNFIECLCRAKHILNCSEDLYQCAWETFLSVYRSDPDSFSSSGSCGWERARSAICDRLTDAKRSDDFWNYHQTSLDQPVNSEVSAVRMELLRAPCGDFSNSVCFRDYLQHMDRDVCRVACGLISGSCINEIRLRYGWDHDYMRQVYSDLCAGIQEYVSL